ncbi:MAG: hypothetical protein JW969_12755 [Spirochaetales bacterium]|nr:hypothetical protein [Spirochaetales bacterium]
MDEEKIREMYENMPDDQLLNIALNEMDQLRDEFKQILRGVLRDRNLLSQTVKETISAGEEEMEEEFEKILESFRQTPCPLCQGHSRLNALSLRRTLGVLLFSFKWKRVVIGCPDCLNKKYRGAQLFNWLLGFWGFPGWYLAPIYLLGNKRDYSNMLNSGDEPTEDLINYVKENQKWLKVKLLQ